MIFSQSHPTAIGSLIFPSESLNDDPSNEIQSAGRVVTWSGPAIAIGVLLFSDHPSQDVSFLLGKKSQSIYKIFIILINAMVRFFNSLHPVSTFVVEFLKKLSIPYYFISQRKRDIGSGV